MSPELTVGIDEVTVVLRPCERVSYTEWPRKIEKMIDRFVEKVKLEEVFGPLSEATGRLQAGYTSGLTISNRPFHFQICYSDLPFMGVCIRFSAYAWYVYQQEYSTMFGGPMDLAEFLYMVQDPLYSTRLSRVDLTADYKNYPCPLNPSAQLSPDTLYRQLMSGDYRIVDSRGRSTIREFSAVHESGTFQTAYCGSRRNKANSFLRLYDKKQEQISTMGFRYEEAQQCESWTRFEAVLRHDAAHKFTETILDLKNSSPDPNRNLTTIIAAVFLDKWRFYDTATDSYLDITEDLAGIANGITTPVLSSTSHPRDNTLKQSIEHLRKSSGLYSCLYKSFALYGGKADRELFDYLWDDYINTYKVNLYTGTDKPRLHEIQAWLRCHQKEVTKFPLEAYLDRSGHDTTGFEPAYED